MYKVQKEFSRFANSYDRYSIIQKDVSIKLINLIDFKPQKILDLGSGTGEVIRNINWKFDKFIGIDISEDMCKIHPKNKNIEVQNLSFEDENIYNQNLNFDIVISSSAIQWAKDLNRLFFNISKVSQNIAFAIFTSNTFTTIHKISNLNSPIYSSEELLENLNRYFNFSYEIKNYKLKFENKIEMFRYIKKSGVSGGFKRLEFKDTKNLIKNYPFNYLEFEVIFMVGEIKKNK